MVALFAFSPVSKAAQNYIIRYNTWYGYYVTSSNPYTINPTLVYTVVRNADGTYKIIPSTSSSNNGNTSASGNMGSTVPQQPAVPPSNASVSPAPSGNQSSPSAPTTTLKDDYTLTQDEKTMIDYVNEERTKVGLKPLAVDLKLAQVARLKAQDMKNLNYFSHTSPTYGSPFDMMKSFGITYRTTGENIAKNSSVLKAHLAFMNSEGHRANILNSTFTHIGVGIVDYSGSKIVVEMFIGK